MWNPALRALAVLAAVTLALSACGDDSDTSTATTTTSPMADETSDEVTTSTGTETTEAEVVTDPGVIAARLTAAGLGCEDYEENPDPNPEVGRSGDCTLADGDAITIDTFESEAAYDAYVRIGETQGCTYFAGGTIAWATGPHWAVAISIPFDEELTADLDATQALADALDGQLETIEC